MILIWIIGLSILILFLFYFRRKKKDRREFATDVIIGVIVTTIGFSLGLIINGKYEAEQTKDELIGTLEFIKEKYELVKIDSLSISLRIFWDSIGVDYPLRYPDEQELLRLASYRNQIIDQPQFYFVLSKTFRTGYSQLQFLQIQDNDNARLKNFEQLNLALSDEIFEIGQEIKFQKGLISSDLLDQTVRDRRTNSFFESLKFLDGVEHFSIENDHRSLQDIMDSIRRTNSDSIRKTKD